MEEEEILLRRAHPRKTKTFEIASKQRNSYIGGASNPEYDANKAGPLDWTSPQ